MSPMDNEWRDIKEILWPLNTDQIGSCEFKTSLNKSLNFGLIIYLMYKYNQEKRNKMIFCYFNIIPQFMFLYNSL